MADSKILIKRNTSNNNAPAENSLSVGELAVNLQTGVLYAGKGVSGTTGTTSIALGGQDATDAVKGIASFDNTNFTVTNGNVALGNGSGNVEVSGTLGVTGNATLRGNADVVGTLAVTGDTTLRGDANVHGNAEITGTLGVTGNANLRGNLTVGGDLTVSGTTTTVNSSTVTIDDSQLKLADGNTSSDAVDIGVYGEYSDGADVMFTGFFRDASDGDFNFYKGLKGPTYEPGTTVDTATAASTTGYELATVNAIIDGGSYS